jgi:hypothetical protein
MQTYLHILENHQVRGNAVTVTIVVDIGIDTVFDGYGPDCAGTDHRQVERVCMQNFLPSSVVGGITLLRNAAMGVAAARLGLEDGYVEALVAGEGEQWLEDHSEQRESVCKSDYGRYLRILASEAMLRGAAAELQQMATPDSIGGTPDELLPTFSESDVTAVAKIVHQIYDKLDNGEVEGLAIGLMESSKRHLCAAYLAAGRDLIRRDLYPAVIEVAERLVVSEACSSTMIKDAIVAGERRSN